MPFERPTLTDLRAQTAADINAALPGVDALLRYSNLGIIADVIAALSAGQYGYLDWIALQSVPFTATGENLEGWAALKGVTRKPATPATGTITFVAANGTVVPAGTPINRTDGVAFSTIADATAIAGSVVVTAAAVEPGADANSPTSTAFILGTGIAGVGYAGSAVGPMTGGVDLESDAELRSRMLLAYSTPPQGGALTDYPVYALAVPGVTRAWVKPAIKGAGTLGVYFMMDQAQAARGGFPQGTDGVSAFEARDAVAAGDQLAVANAIFPKQSVTALVYALAPTPNKLSFTIAGLSSASADTRAAITDAITAALLVNAVPGGITNLSAIEAAIAGVTGTAGFVITAIAATAGVVGNGGVGNIQSNAGALPQLNQVTYS